MCHQRQQELLCRRLHDDVALTESLKTGVQLTSSSVVVVQLHAVLSSPLILLLPALSSALRQAGRHLGGGGPRLC